RPNPEGHTHRIAVEHQPALRGSGPAEARAVRGKGRRAVRSDSRAAPQARWQRDRRAGARGLRRPRRAAARGQQVPGPHRQSRPSLRNRSTGRRQESLDRVPEDVLMPENSNASRPAPRANTGSAFLNFVADLSTRFVHLERRFDPFFRPAFDAILRDPLARLTTALINAGRPNEGLKIAERRPIPDEEPYRQPITDSFTKQMRSLWKPGGFERGGNTKTHGIVRGEFIVHDNLPERFRHGIFAKPQTFRAWVRFSGPGPYITPDIEDVGFMSISI